MVTADDEYLHTAPETETGLWSDNFWLSICDREADVFGDVPNVAARVQAAAEPGTVVITEAVNRLVSGLFVVEDLGTSALKGVSGRVALHRVVQPSGVRGRFHAAAAAGGLTHFVGREAELLRSLAAEPVDLVDAPAGLWDRIAAGMAADETGSDETASDEPVAEVVPLDHRRSSTRRRALLVGVAACLVALAVSVGVVVASRPDQGPEQLAAATLSDSFGSLTRAMYQPIVPLPNVRPSSK